jgi:hypothetical protein
VRADNSRRVSRTSRAALRVASASRCEAYDNSAIFRRDRCTDFVAGRHY